MTEADFLALIPRDRDALIHSEAMGIDLTGFEWPKGGPGKSMVKVRPGRVEWMDIPYYTTDWNAAAQVMERLSTAQWWRIQSPFTPTNKWSAGFTPHGVSGWNGRPDVLASADTGPLSICMAAIEVDNSRRG